MNTYHKTLTAKDARKIEREVEMQKIAVKYGFTPKIIDFKLEYNKITSEYTGNIIMEHLNAPCLADIYSDDPAKIPKWIWIKIKEILQTLYDNEGIEYIDITGYNFIEKDNKIYIIDFGDAQYSNKFKKINWFLDEFLNGHYGWNPDFY